MQYDGYKFKCAKYYLLGITVHQSKRFLIGGIQITHFSYHTNYIFYN
jgi:hypothetical protein